jgi:hemerythrin-like domain-containing protein
LNGRAAKETIMQNPAGEAIEIIKDEHRSMGAVVKGMQARVAAVKAGTEPPDAYLLRARLDYVEMMPDRVHHPKEDEFTG